MSRAEAVAAIEANILSEPFYRALEHPCSDGSLARAYDDLLCAIRRLPVGSLLEWLEKMPPFYRDDEELQALKDAIPALAREEYRDERRAEIRTMLRRLKKESPGRTTVQGRIDQQSQLTNYNPAA